MIHLLQRFLAWGNTFFNEIRFPHARQAVRVRCVVSQR